MKIGYARVSTKEQNLDIQIEALKASGCERIYEEKVSGKKKERSQLNMCLDYLRDGDILIVFDLSRLGRTSKQVIELIDYFNQKNIGFISIKEGLDITTSMGRAFAGLLAVINQMNVEVQNEKIVAGIKKARARGKVGGRPGISEEKKNLIKTLYESRDYPLVTIAQMAKVSRATVYNVINSLKKMEENNDVY